MCRFSRIAVFSGMLIVSTGCDAGLNSTQPKSVTRSDMGRVESSDFSVLFVGNSHTARHEIPGTVGKMLRYLLPSHSFYVHCVPVTFLDDAARDANCQYELTSRAWKFVILQGQKISLSGQMNYSTAEGVSVARQAKTRGARAFFFSEWGMKGVLGGSARHQAIYSAMARESQSEVIPVGRAWDCALERRPELQLHDDDGNHQNSTGAFLSACVITGRISGQDPSRLGSFPALEVNSSVRAFLAECASMALRSRQFD